MTYALALHTTSSELGLAISNFATEQRAQTWELGRSLSTHLHIYLGEFLHPQTWADLTFLAVAIGPGSFTSTRIGVVTARTLAQQLEIPLFPISTLAAVAWSAYQKQSLTEVTDSGGVQPSAVMDIAVQMPAQRGEVFSAIYSLGQAPISSDTASAPPLPTLVALLADTVYTAEQWQQRLDTWERPYQLVTAEEPLGASVVSLLDLAYGDWQQGICPHWSATLPFYGQSYVT